jgi:hypothetical protein
MRLARRPFVVLLISLATSGCRACSSCGNVAKSIGEIAPEEDVKEQARKELERSPQTLSTICGVNVSGLKDMVVTVVKSEWAKHQVKVEGTAIRAVEPGPDDDDATEADAAPPVVIAPLKTILCVGVVLVFIDPVMGSDGKRTAWKVTNLEVDSVQTLEVTFDKAKSSRRGHRHHH